MSIRLFHRGARLVLVVRRRAAGVETWWSPHFTPPGWTEILGGQLQLLGLSPEPAATPGRLAVRLGEINWITASRWSIITLHLRGGSEVKRRLVTGALLKAARYARPRG
jgi:hypothetical protein